MSQERLNQLEVKLEEHIRGCEDRFKRIDDRTEKLIASQEKLNETLGKLAEDTKGVVGLYQGAQAAVSIGVGVQRFGLWLVKWPLIGTGLYTAYTWVIEHLFKT